MIDYDKKLARLEKRYFPKKKRGFLETGKFVETAIQELYEFYQNMGYSIRCVVGMREASSMFYEIVPQFPVSLTPFDKEDTIDWESYTSTDAVLVLGSFNSSRKVESRFWNKNITCAIINLYDYFYFRGYELHTDFWEYCIHRRSHKQTMVQRRNAWLRHGYYQYGIWHKILGHFSLSKVLAVNDIMSRMYCMRRAYESRQGNKEWQAMYLQRFLYECIKSRDYLTTQKYIQEYGKHSYEGAKRYQEFLIKWEEMLEEIKGRISRRRKEDIVIQWLDAISKERMVHLPYVSRLAEENTQLEKAYAVIPQTTATMKSIFTGEKVMEGKLYRYKRIAGPAFKVLEEIQKQRYRFYYIAPRHLAQKLFSKDCCAPMKIQEDDILFPYYYWNMVCLLAASKKKLFLLIHELWTTHPPYFAPELPYFDREGIETAPEEQKRMACRYADRQCEYWDRFFNEQICRIYMGDHGDYCPYPRQAYSKRMSHVMFAMKNEKRKLTKTDALFSLKDIGKLIAYSMGWEECSEASLYSDAVYIEEMDSYSANAVKAVLQKEAVYSDYRNWMQSRTIRTKRDMLVRYANGEEWYFLLPDEETNHVQDCEYQDRIQELRNRLGDEFIDIWKDEFFKESRKLYAK